MKNPLNKTTRSQKASFMLVMLFQNFDDSRLSWANISVVIFRTAPGYFVLIRFNIAFSVITEANLDA